MKTFFKVIISLISSIIGFVLIIIFSFIYFTFNAATSTEENYNQNVSFNSTQAIIDTTLKANYGFEFKNIKLCKNKDVATIYRLGETTYQSHFCLNGLCSLTVEYNEALNNKTVEIELYQQIDSNKCEWKTIKQLILPISYYADIEITKEIVNNLKLPDSYDIKTYKAHGFSSYKLFSNKKITLKYNKPIKEDKITIGDKEIKIIF